jgi:hypothetical protein
LRLRAAQITFFDEGGRRTGQPGTQGRIGLPQPSCLTQPPEFDS